MHSWAVLPQSFSRFFFLRFVPYYIFCHARCAVVALVRRKRKKSVYNVKLIRWYEKLLLVLPRCSETFSFFFSFPYCFFFCSNWAYIKKLFFFSRRIMLLLLELASTLHPLLHVIVVSRVELCSSVLFFLLLLALSLYVVYSQMYMVKKITPLKV